MTTTETTTINDIAISIGLRRWNIASGPAEGGFYDQWVDRVLEAKSKYGRVFVPGREAAEIDMYGGHLPQAYEPPTAEDLQ